MAESEEELKSLLMKVKEESEKVGLSIWAAQQTPMVQLSRHKWCSSADTNHAAQRAILMELSRQESHSSAGKDQGAEQARTTQSAGNKHGAQQ